MRVIVLWLLWRVFGVQSVVLEDFDGEVNARIVSRLGNVRSARRFIGASVRLLQDGKLRGPRYVERWHPLYPPGD